MEVLGYENLNKGVGYVEKRLGSADLRESQSVIKKSTKEENF